MPPDAALARPAIDDPAVQNSAVYEAEQADLNGATADYRPQGQSGAGTADIRRGQNVTFWVDSTSDGYSDLAFRYKDAGAAGVTVNGLSLGGGLDGARGELVDTHRQGVSQRRNQQGRGHRVRG